MKSRFAIILLIFLIAANNSFGQNAFNITRTKYQRAKDTYGFLLGQEHSIELIKTKFPNLIINATLAEEGFNAAFDGSRKRIKDFLINGMGDSLFKRYFDTVLFEAKKLFDKIELTKEIASALIAEISKRAVGAIPSPILETLLFFEYSERPEKEFSLGFTQLFKTKGHIKAKGTDWQITVPKSWRAQEGERPNIIQKFTSDYGEGKQSIMLMVKELDLPKGYKTNKQEIAQMFTEPEMKQWVGEGGKYISFTKMTLDSHPGGMLETEQLVSRLNLQLKIRMVSSMFVRNSKMYFLQGTVSSNNTNEDLSPLMKKFLPLYMLVANSIVVNEQYN